MQILTLYEREKIEFSLRIKRGIRDIAKVLGRDPSVISREISRNTLKGKKYSAQLAQAKADRRAKKTNTRKLESDWRLHDFVEKKLKKGWSPELIAGRLKEHPPLHLQGVSVSHEQIYQYIYFGEGRYEGWYHYLTKKHAKRQQVMSRKKQPKTLIKERVFITERPKIINDRERFGDWESDQAQFKKQKERLSVQYERKAMIIRMHRVKDKTADENEQAIEKTLDPFPHHLRQSMTFDNGTENVCHAKIRDSFDLETYFCAPYGTRAG